MILIGLGHKARNGKDTFAAAVREAYGDQLDIRLMSFADPLRQEVREAAREIFNVNFPGYEFNPQEALRMLCIFHGVRFEENAPVDEDYPWGKQRALHQFWGTDYRRAQDPDYWTKRAIERILAARASGADATFLRDLRFPNEYDLLGDLGGWRLKISRLGYVSDVPQHISETALDHHPFDAHVGVRDGELNLLRELSVDTFKRLWQRTPGNALKLSYATL